MANSNSFLQSPFESITDTLKGSADFTLPPATKARDEPRIETPKASKGISAPADLMPVFEASAKAFDVPVNVLMALGHQESRFNPNAIGPATEWGRAKGMMQYLDSTAKNLGINPFDPNEAIPAAAKQLRERLDKGYSMEDAVKEHFAGPDRKKWGEKTAAYGKEVMAKAGMIGEQFIGGGSSSTKEQSSQIATDLNKDEPGRYKPIDDDWISTHLSTSLPRPLYEYGLKLVNPKADSAFIASAMKDYDAAQQAKAEAGGNAVQRRFDTLQTPDAVFNQKLDQRLAGPQNGIVPQLPTATDMKVADANSNFEQEINKPRPGIVEQAGNDLSRGLSNLKGLGYGIGALAADTVGMDGAADSLLSSYVANQNKIAKENPAVIGTYKNVHSLGDAGRYAVEAVFENLPMILPALVSGGVGAAVARKGAESLVAGMVESQVAKGIAREVAEKNAAQFVAKRIAMGAAGGTAPSTIGMEAGSIYGDTFQETGKKAPGVALAYGIPAGLLDTIEPVMALRKIAGPAVDQLAGHIIKRFGVEAGKQFMVEAGTEGLQTILENAATAQVGGKPLLSEKLADDVIDSMLKGGIAGGVTGVASQGVEEIRGATTSQQASPAAPTTKPAPTVTVTPPEPSKAAGPLTRAVENAATEPARVKVETPSGVVTGFVESHTEDTAGNFQTRIIGDDGQVYNYSNADGVTITPEKGPLTGAVEKAAEKAPQADIGIPMSEQNQQVADAPLTNEGANSASVVAQNEPISAKTEEQPAKSEKVEPALVVEAKAPEDTKSLEDMTEEELRARLKYMASQAKNTGGWNRMLIDERRKVENQINKLADAKAAATVDLSGRTDEQLAYMAEKGKPGFKEAAQAEIEKRKGANNGSNADAVPVLDDSAQGNQGAAQVQGNQQGASSGAGAGDAGARPDTGALEPADGAPVSGANGTADTKPALRDEYAGKWFGSKEKADAFIAKKKIGDTHAAVQTGKVRWEVKQKQAAPLPGATKMVEDDNKWAGKSIKLFRGEEKGATPGFRQGGALWTTTDRNLAENYAGKDGVVKEYSTTLKKPFVFDDDTAERFAAFYDFGSEKEKKSLIEFFKELGLSQIDATVRQRLIDAGYDSVVVMREGGVGRNDEHPSVILLEDKPESATEKAEAAPASAQQTTEGEGNANRPEQSKAGEPDQQQATEQAADVSPGRPGQGQGEAPTEEVTAPSASDASKKDDFRAVLSKNIRAIIPQQQKFERTFGKSQWAGYLKKLIAGNDVLRQFSKTPGAAGGTAWVKPALANATEAKDLIRIADKLESTSSASEAKTVDPTKPDTTPPEKVESTSELAKIFDGLSSKSPLVRSRAAADLKNNPLAEKIAYVQSNILDILGELEDSGKVKINCD